MNIYVSNLSFNVRDEDLQEYFAEYGEVSSAKVIMDKFTNKSRGFAFVEMPSDEAANKAIQELDGAGRGGAGRIAAADHTCTKSYGLACRGWILCRAHGCCRHVQDRFTQNRGRAGGVRGVTAVNRRDRVRTVALSEARIAQAR